MAAMLYVKFGTAIPFTWWVAIGAGTTFAAGYIASFALPDGRNRGV
jgi:hypothetical protein